MLSWFRGRRDDDPEALLGRGETERAIELLEERLREDPDDTLTRRWLAEALERSGDTGRAVAVLLSLADRLGEDGHVTQSFAVLKHVERLDPSPAVAERAWRLLRVGSGQDSSITYTTSEIVLDDWLDTPEEREDFLASPIFAGLSESELGRLFDELRLLRKHSGAIVHVAGEPAGGLFVLASGAVRVYRPDAENRHEQVALLREGDLFGLGGVLGRPRRSHTVTAAGKCEILEIRRDVFDRLAGRHPEIRERIEALAAERADLWASGGEDPG